MLAIVLAAVLPVIGGGTPLRAQPETCPTPVPDSSRVTILEPAPGSPVSGRVMVRGSAVSPVGVARVELFVGDARKDFAVFNPPVRDGTFMLAWESGGAPVGQATLRVVACGGGQGTVPVARGRGEVVVDVQPSSSPAAPAPLTQVTGDDPADRDRGPLWVGAAVGLSGLVGLAVAAGYRPGRRSGRRRPVAPSPPAGGKDTPSRRRS